MTPGFTEDQRRALGRYVRALGDMLGLRDWAFELMFDPPPNAGAIAMVQPVYGRKVATVWFMRTFADLPPDKLRHAIVHELTHCILDRITSVLENQGPKLLGQPVYAVLWQATHEASEFATDQIADVLAPTLPLIDWVDLGDDPSRVVWTDEPTEPADPEPPE